MAALSANTVRSGNDPVAGFELEVAGSDGWAGEPGGGAECGAGEEVEGAGFASGEASRTSSSAVPYWRAQVSGNWERMACSAAWLPSIDAGRGGFVRRAGWRRLVVVMAGTVRPRPWTGPWT
jgi:hypothetical protein